MQQDNKLNALKHLYKSLEPSSMNELAPRTGYYLIKGVFNTELEGHHVKAASALWKRNAKDLFNEDFIVTIQLRSFERNQFQGSEALLNSNLTGNIIQVKHAAKTIQNGRTVFIVKWDVLLSNSVDSDYDELNTIAQMEDSVDEELDLLSAMLTQLQKGDDVFDAILRMEDNNYEEHEETNDWIFDLLAQDLPTNNNTESSITNI